MHGNNPDGIGNGAGQFSRIADSFLIRQSFAVLGNLFKVFYYSLEDDFKFIEIFIGYRIQGWPPIPGIFEIRNLVPIGLNAL